MTVEDPALERAKRHVKGVRDFFYHLMTYLLVSGMMVVIDRSDGVGDGLFGLDWAYWIIIPWGFGVCGHAISVFFGEYRVHEVYRREKDRELEHL